MKKLYIYRNWNYLVLLNNLITFGSHVYVKKILFLRFDTNKFFFWIYSKKIRLQNKKISSLRKRFTWN